MRKNAAITDRVLPDVVRALRFPNNYTNNFEGGL
jgi:hypothetical protein